MLPSTRELRIMQRLFGAGHSHQYRVYNDVFGQDGQLDHALYSATLDRMRQKGWLAAGRVWLSLTRAGEEVFVRNNDRLAKEAGY